MDRTAALFIVRGQKKKMQRNPGWYERDVKKWLTPQGLIFYWTIDP